MDRLHQLPDPRKTVNTVTSHAPKPDAFERCGQQEWPPSPPIAPSPPAPPPAQPGACGMIAPWYTQRNRLTNEPKRTAGQCKKITEWYTNTGGGQSILSGIRVGDIYCKNADGAIVYCRAIDTGIDPNLVSCEGEATCTPFTPSKSSNSVLNCFDDGNGQELPEFSDGNGGYTYLDSNGVYNCLHKYGQLYLDFVDTCNGNYNANVNELTATTIRAPDTSAAWVTS